MVPSPEVQRPAMARRRDDFPAPELPTIRRFSPSGMDISRLRMRVGLKSGVVRVRLWMESAACGVGENRSVPRGAI